MQPRLAWKLTSSWLYFPSTGISGICLHTWSIFVCLFVCFYKLKFIMCVEVCLCVHLFVRHCVSAACENLKRMLNPGTGIIDS